MCSIITACDVLAQLISILPPLVLYSCQVYQNTMAGRDGVSFPASSPDSAVATGTQQLKGSHFRSSVTELPNPAVAFRQPVSSCEYQFA